MKKQINPIFCALLPIALLVGGTFAFEEVGLVSKNLYKSKVEKDYALIYKIGLPTELFQQTNDRPVVKIIAPKDKSMYPMDTRVAYEINVSDKEDGESKYGEIPQNNVVLKVEYIENLSVPIENNKEIQMDSLGLIGILNSNCLNCHAFKNKLIGPSFYEISKHYEPTQTNMSKIVANIKEGSSGVWGETVMPSHPELSNQEIHEMVLWIMENAGESNIDYYIGTEGSIKLPHLEDSEKHVVFILTASYTDYGWDGNHKLKGQDSVIIYSK